MKKIITLVLFAVFVNSYAQQNTINWVTLDEAIKLQAKSPKKIMMDVYTNWCGPCKMLDKNTFHNPDVVDYVNKNFYAVKFNAEGNDVINFKGNTFSNSGYDPALANRRNSAHEFTSFLKVRAYPTIVFFDENLDVIAPVRGYQKPQQLELYLKLFNSDDYQSMSTQEDFNAYYNSFTPTFRGK